VIEIECEGLTDENITSTVVSEEYAPQDLYNHTVASDHSFDVLAIDRFLVINLMISIASNQ
jgi:hypothetical protein